MKDINEQEQNRLQGYVQDMEKIKMRIEVIRNIVEGKKTTGQSITDKESICLQIRKILELIIFSRLQVNQDVFMEDISSRQYVKKIWKKLNEKNLNNFHPITINKGGKIDEFEDIEDVFFNNKTWSEVYDRCSEVIHHTNPLAFPSNLPSNEEIIGWVNQIMSLLNDHLFKLPNSDDIIYRCTMSTLPNQNVVVQPFERVSS